MINWWLIVVAVIMLILILGLSIYLVILYSSEEDENQAWFPKVVVVISLSLACITCLLLPFDVANRKNPTSMAKFGGGINTVQMWTIILWTIVGFVVVLIPFTTHYYEAYDPEQHSAHQQIYPAMIYTAIGMAMFGGLCAVLWVTVGYAEIKYVSYLAFPQPYDMWSDSVVYIRRTTNETLELKVSIFVYVVGLLTALGWLLFFVFGGVGLSALPIELITGYINRPRPMTAAAYNHERDIIASKAQTLLGIGKELQTKQRTKNNNTIRKKINMFRAEVFELERSFERIEIAYKQAGGSIFITFGKLFVGVIGIFLSMLWIMHIFVYNTVDANPFLNTFFMDLDAAFSLFGTLAYAIFTFYLLWCTVKGCFKVGMRLIFFTIHPMKVGDTLMNSMLFNCGLILLCSVTVTQFSAISFRDYANNTAVDTLLNVYVRKLKGIGYIMQYFQFGFVAMALLSVFWIMICPKSKKKDLKKDDDDD